MQVVINIDEKSEKGKHLLQLLSEMKIDFSKDKISVKDAAFGIGREASDVEMDDYLNRCMSGTLSNLE